VPTQKKRKEELPYSISLTEGERGKKKRKKEEDVREEGGKSEIEHCFSVSRCALAIKKKKEGAKKGGREN